MVCSKLPGLICLVKFFYLCFTHLLVSFTIQNTFQGNTLTSYLFHVNVLYNKAIKIILNESPNAHMILISQFNVLPFHDLYVCNCCVFMFKMYYNLFPNIIYNMFTMLSAAHTRGTVSMISSYHMLDLHICKCCIIFNGNKVWLQLSNSLKDIVSLTMIKTNFFLH